VCAQCFLWLVERWARALSHRDACDERVHA
jgi:hypothetical protein